MPHRGDYCLSLHKSSGPPSKYFLGRDDASVIPARRSHTAAGILPARKISHL